jgi:hypothetical protein
MMDHAKRLAAAREWDARARLQRREREREAAAMLPLLQGDMQAVTGRLHQPGEYPGIAPLNTQESIFGVEESQVLTRVDRED